MSKKQKKLEKPDREYCEPNEKEKENFFNKKGYNMTKILLHTRADGTIKRIPCCDVKDFPKHMIF